MASPPTTPPSGQQSGTGTSQFDTAQGPGGLDELEKKVLGPSYNYSGHIKSPSEMGMSAEGDFGVLADDVGGLLGYVDLLVGGQCTLGKCASKNLTNKDGSGGGTYGAPLGNQFFLDTAVKCKDVVSGNKVTRSIYINNIPDGRIPIISEVTGASFDDFKGIMPGIMSNIAQIRPMQILMAFVTGASSACQMVTMPTTDVNNRRGSDTRYITNTDIDIMPASWFPRSKPKSTYNLKDPDTFCTMSTIPGTNLTTQKQNTALEGSKIDYSKMPNDVVIKFYYSVLGLLGLYILLRLMLRKK
jgi:hypothetical protein